MARIADPEKLYNIKKAVMECIVNHGYAGVSTALICESAGVSPGYLYRFYDSKDELVQELVDSETESIRKNFTAIIESSVTVYEVAYKIIKQLFFRANEDRLTTRFTAHVVMDLKVPAKEKTEKYKNILQIAERCIELGRKTGEFSHQITPMEVLIISFTIPFRYLAFSLELEENKKFTEEEVKRIAEICVNALK
ncbi:MAG TPA: TetR/AcrR family transcriptional regulator [Clostridia bacterium]|nr:TetR/AcrR family transcriptional regulator [Clostridia bacterium]